MNGIVRDNLTLVVSGNCSLFSGRWLLKPGKDNIYWIQDTCDLDKVTFLCVTSDKTQRDNC